MNRQQRRAAEKQSGAPSTPAQRAFLDASAHHAAGRLAEAERGYRRALALDPRHADSLQRLGVLALQRQDPAAALEHFRAALALTPSDAAAHYNLGSTLFKLGQMSAAAEAFHQAATLQPDMVDAHNGLGAALHALGRHDEAAAALRQAIALKPSYAEAHYNLANTLSDQGDKAEAEAAYRRAIQLKPDHADAVHNLGRMLLDDKKQEQALPLLRKAVELSGGKPEFLNNLAVALYELGRLSEAEPRYRTVLEQRPDFAEAHNNLGTTLYEQGRYDEAVASFRRGIELQPNFPGARANLGQALLAEGRMAEGWAEYEGRWSASEFGRAQRGFHQPPWRGEPGEGHTLLVHAEQGFGDTLQFCRYVPFAAARGFKVVFEVQKPLARLLRQMEGVEVVARGDELPPFDLHAPLLSLPHLLGPEIGDFPTPMPYLHAHAPTAADWGAILAKLGPGLRVGLAWAGSPSLKADRRRSIPPERLKPLTATPGVIGFSLQKDGEPAPADLGLIDYMAGMEDFAATASLVANLDLVIAVDTAVAHLAAALGRPTWVLNRFDGCWRWMRGREDSPWYPSLKLYRQPKPGDWDIVLEAVGRDLAKLAKTA